LHHARSIAVERGMTPRLPLVAGILLVAATAAADGKTPAIHRLDGLVVMTPSPTQAPPPGLRLRTMVRPTDRLWIGPDIPSFVPLEVGELKLDVLDARPGGGFIATYRERFEPCYARGADANCGTLVKIFDASKVETVSLSLDAYLSRKEHLEIQDVRYSEDGTLYFNEACQSYSKEAGGKCSALVALDPIAKKVLWRTAPLVSNNAFLLIGNYAVTAYGFTGEKASIRVVRRSDGKVMDVQPLQSTNFEMTTKGDTLSVEMYMNVGRANFHLDGFAGASPKLVALPTTPPDPIDKPKPYDPPLIKPVVKSGDATATPSF
jgi:hypothetical protein